MRLRDQAFLDQAHFRTICTRVQSRVVRRALLGFAVVSLLTLALTPTAQAAFGLSDFDVRFTEKDGTRAELAGSHPYKMTTSFLINNTESGTEPGKFFVDGGDIKDLILEQARGFIGDATAVPQCQTIDFAGAHGTFTDCPLDTVVGATASVLLGPLGDPSSEIFPGAVYNLVPPPGVAVRIGFVTKDVPLVIDVGIKNDYSYSEVREGPDYDVVADVRNIPQPLTVFGAVTELWGVPADPSHDFARGVCIGSAAAFGKLTGTLIQDGELNLVDLGGETCPADAPTEKPLLTLPRTCEEPLATDYRLDPWNAPGAFVGGSVLTHDYAEPPVPQVFIGCERLEFEPGIDSKATADTAETGTGLDFEIDFVDEIDPDKEGLTEPGGQAGSDIKKTVVTLPKGVTVNPSIAEGLSVCTPADLDRETVSSAPGEGCPNASKIGTVSVETPLVDEVIEGNVFIAQQDDPATAAEENPFDSLIAFYIVLKNPRLGALVKIPAKVEPDPVTGQLVTTAEDLPQIPFSRFKFHFREGQRAPLITPPTCGTYTTAVELTPWARPEETLTETATFQITRGVGGGPCPAGGTPPFKPGFEAGSLNNAAGAYSPFYMRLTRNDGDQDLTRFDAVLPPGVVAKLAGTSRCPAAQISLAKSKSGRAELASPSCPTNSQIGHVLGGAGVGSALTYVPGKIYMAGPFGGAPLSVVAIVPAVAGPFDAGTVVTQQALKIDPRTAEVRVDGASSDPIPHILKGIPLKVRDIRVYVDRSGFTLNPTSCDPFQTLADIWGGGSNPFSTADNSPFSASSRFQAADCARLGFKPSLSLRLRGGTHRGDNPALRGVFKPRSGDANLEGLVLRFPRSAFLDQGHIRTICTRVQFAADNCPKGAVYGRAMAFTPLLDEPLEGPVYLRSSNHNLPDFVADLRGLVDVEAVARIDSKNGGIRATFEDVPDAPISKVVVNMQGGKKGLIVNSANLCHAKHNANAQMSAHNAKRSEIKPVLGAQCGKKKR